MPISSDSGDKPAMMRDTIPACPTLENWVLSGTPFSVTLFPA